MNVRVRKVTTVTEDWFQDAGRSIGPRPWRTATSTAVLENPWLSEESAEDAATSVRDTAAEIARILSAELVAAMGGASNLEAYGKASVTGLAGEVEHAAAVMLDSAFDDGVRIAAEASGPIYATATRGPAGLCVSIPITHKNDDSIRTHYETIEVVIPDSPDSSELMVILGGTSGGRPFARLSNREQDRHEMGIA